MWEVVKGERGRGRTGLKIKSVPMDFESQRLSAHIRKFVHSSLWVLTWIPSSMLSKVCVKQGCVNCCPGFQLEPLLQYIKTRPLSLRKAWLCKIFAFCSKGLLRKENSTTKPEITGKRQPTGSLGLLTKHGKQATSQIYSTGTYITWCHQPNWRFNVFSCMQLRNLYTTSQILLKRRSFRTAEP